MGLVWRKRKRVGRNTHLNMSTGGASLSHKRGPVTINSRGQVSVRIAPGLSWRFRLWR